MKIEKKKLKKYKQNMQALWDTIKKTNLQIMGIEEEMQAKGIENIFH
jgi:hypothetical protein